MPPVRPSHSVTCLGMIALFASLHAADPKAPDPGLPQNFDPNTATGLLQHPPFTRALNLSESLSLTGVAFVEGKPVATVKDRTTNKSYIISDEPNALGWKLASATPSTQLKRAEVKMMVGSEVVTLHYSDTQTATAAPKGYMPSHIPTEQEFTGHDDKGNYVRGVPYLSDQDRERFRNVPRDQREKFLEIVHDQREMLFKASHEDRAAFVKKAFDRVFGRQ